MPYKFDQKVCWFFYNIIKIAFQKYIKNAIFYFYILIIYMKYEIALLPQWVINNFMYNCLVAILLNMRKWQYVLNLNILIECKSYYFVFISGGKIAGDIKFRKAVP